MTLTRICCFAGLMSLAACGGGEDPTSTDEALHAAGVAACQAGMPDPHACPPANPNKAMVCHIPPGNPANSHTICVGNPAVPAHLAHGDQLGSCCTATPPATDDGGTAGAGGAGGGAGGAGGAGGGTGGTGGGGTGGTGGTDDGGPPPLF
jgi:hypothetical protein